MSTPSTYTTYFFATVDPVEDEQTLAEGVFHLTSKTMASYYLVRLLLVALAAAGGVLGCGAMWLASSVPAQAARTTESVGLLTFILGGVVLVATLVIMAWIVPSIHTPSRLRTLFAYKATHPAYRLERVGSVVTIEDTDGYKLILPFHEARQAAALYVGSYIHTSVALRITLMEYFAILKQAGDDAEIRLQLMRHIWQRTTSKWKVFA